MSTISTDAERIDDMQRRRYQLPTQPLALEQRIADALAGDIAADQLAELIADTRTAIGQASAAAEAARARAYDPAIVDPTARRSMEAADHLARRLRLALPRLETAALRQRNAQEYATWAAEFDAIKAKHTAASTRLRQVYSEFEHQLVSALTEARKVDVEVRKVLDNKPTELPQSNGDGRRLPTVELAARHLDGVDQQFSLMTMRLPAFSAPNKLSWPPPTPPILPQDVMPVLPGGGDWHRGLAQRDAERRAESQRVANYYAQQTKQREEREAAEAKAERQRMRNGGSP